MKLFIKLFLEPLKKILFALFKAVFAPKELFEKAEGLNEENLRAMLQRYGVSDMLLYRAAYRIGDDMTMYEMADGRKGFIFRINPPVYLSEDTEEKLSALYSSINIDGAVLNMSTFASRNIDEILNEFRECHPCEPNVKNRGIFKELIEFRIRMLKRGTTESILKGFDLRVRDFINLCSVSLPHDIEDEEVESFYYKIKGSIAEFSPVDFTPDRLVMMIQEILNPELESWDAVFDRMKKLNKQMTTANTEVHLKPDGGYTFGPLDEEGAFIPGKTWKAKTLTTKKFPNYVPLSELQSTLFNPLKISQIAVPCPFYSSLTITFDQVERRIKKVKSRASWEVSQLNGIPSKTKKKRPWIRKRAEEAESIIEYIDELREIPLEAMWQITLFDNDERRLNQYVSSLKKDFLTSAKGWEITEETFSAIAFQSLIYSLPLQYLDTVKEHLRRFDILFTANNAQITPIFSDARGYGAPVCLYLARSGQLQTFDPFESDTNYNIVKVGSSGSGKSYSEGDFHMMLLAANYKIRVVDAGRSYENLCKLIGGTFIEFNDETDICLNFFTNVVTKSIVLTDPETKERKEVEVIHEDSMVSIIPIIGMMGGLDLGKEESETTEDGSITGYIARLTERAVATAFAARGRDAGMREVGMYLREIEKEEKTKKYDTATLNAFINSLTPYTNESGGFYRFFNGANNVNLESDYVVLELDGLKNKGGLFLVVLMAISQRIEMEFFGDRTRHKLFAIDEGWMIAENVIVMKFIEALYRKIRKYKGMAEFITQSVLDYYKNNKTRSMYENAAWKHSLQQTAQSIDSAMDNKYLSISGFVASLMKSVKAMPKFGFSELMIMEENSLMVSRVKTDIYSHFILSNHPNDVAMLKRVQDKYNMEVLDAIWFVSNQIMNGLDDDTCYEALLAHRKNSALEKEEKIDSVKVDALEAEVAAEEVAEATVLKEY